MPILMQNHSRASPSVTSEQIIDEKHEKNPCILTNIENLAEMSSFAESCPRRGFRIQNLLTLRKQHVIMPARTYCLRIAPFYS